jgi:hypothetical protein
MAYMCGTSFETTRSGTCGAGQLEIARARKIVLLQQTLRHPS